MTFLTDFGDLAVLLPLGGAILLWLLMVRSRHAAAWWLLALVLCIGAIGLLKMYFFACPTFIPVRSPSGHTGLAVLIYGAIAGFVALNASGWVRAAALGAGVTLITGIALSRLALGAHNTVEVLIGCAIGAAALGLFARGGAANFRQPSMPTRRLLLAVVVIVAVMHGHELRAEAMLQAVGLYLKGNPLCF